MKTARTVSGYNIYQFRNMLRSFAQRSVYDKERKKMANTNKDYSSLEKLPEEVYQVLEANHVTCAVVTYNGYGDDGWIEKISLKGKDGVEIDGTSLTSPQSTDESPESVNAWLERLAWRLLKCHFHNFGHDAGACGSLTIEVSDWEASFFHTDREYHYVEV
jgi:hypothetical protein